MGVTCNHFSSLHYIKGIRTDKQKNCRQSRLAILHKSKREATPRTRQRHNCFTFAFAHPPRSSDSSPFKSTEKNISTNKKYPHSNYPTLSYYQSKVNKSKETVLIFLCSKKSCKKFGVFKKESFRLV